MDFSALNWVAIGAGTLAAFLLGWLIYSPLLFGRVWAAGTGISLEEDARPPLFAMLAQLAGLFLLALVIGITAVSNALITAILAVLAAAVLMVANGAFSGKSGAALAIDGGGVIAYGVVMIAAQGLL